MNTLCAQLDQMMEAASESLAGRRYFDCERHCRKALAVAKQQNDWTYYARILLPLQEARRQRRLIAAEGAVRLGTKTLCDAAEDRLTRLAAGSIVLTHPYDARAACDLRSRIWQQGCYFEVLFADNPPSADPWQITTFSGTMATCCVAAPDADWIDRWLNIPENQEHSDNNQRVDIGKPTQRPVDWFLDAYESLGNTALATVRPSFGDLEKIGVIERCLEAVPDHEILHQRLREVAGGLARQNSAKWD